MHIDDYLKNKIAQQNQNALKIQWHITDLCNLRCTHCYSDGFKEVGPSLKEIEQILQNIINTLGYWKKELNQAVTISGINLTGGEPFVRKDFFDILELIRLKYNIGGTILTNGTLITEKIAKKLKKYTSLIQISFDGAETVHDAIRGKGSFKLATEGLKYLVKANIPVVISFTVNKENMLEFPKVVNHARKHGAAYIWSDRMVPAGLQKTKNDSLAMDTQDFLDFFQIMKKEQDKYGGSFIKMHRALQFLISNQSLVYKCAAGKNLINIMPNGDIYPCRRMPLLIGNILKEELKEIYNHKIMQKVLNIQTPKECSKCAHVDTCQGGARCQAYATYNDMHRADPACPLLKFKKVSYGL